jgi:hypothetical protein
LKNNLFFLWWFKIIFVPLQPKSVKQQTLNIMVTLFGRTKLTYEDIPSILDGKISYRDGSFNGEKWYVLRLPNGRYINYLTNDKAREGCINSILKYYQYYESKSEREIISLVRFELRSNEEAEEWLIGEEICSLLKRNGYETEMYSQLGRIGGINASKDGETFKVVSVYPNKEMLMAKLDELKKKLK